VNAAELYEMAITLRERESLLDIAVVVTTGRRSHLLWLSRGDVKHKAKKLLRKGVAEAFLKIHSNGDGKWRAEAEALPGVDPKRAQVLLWNYGRKHYRWENGLN
jgi:hypothetical protein